MRILLLLLFHSSSALALDHNSFYLGIGYFAENSLGKITKESSGDKSFLGAPSYPVVLRYDYHLFGVSPTSKEYFFSPKLTYTLLPREEDGDTLKVTHWHLILPLGIKIGTATNWDLTAGPGILNRTMKGSGGLAQLNNGGSVATFAVPGRKATSQVYTLNLATSYSLDRHQLGFDIVTEGLFSDKRSMSLMFSYMYKLNSSTAAPGRRFR